MPKLLHWCSFEFARNAGATEIHVYLNGEPTVPFPATRVDLEALKHQVAETRKWGGLRMLAPDDGVAVQSEHPLEVSIGWSEHGEKQRIG